MNALFAVAAGLLAAACASLVNNTRKFTWEDQLKTINAELSGKKVTVEMTGSCSDDEYVRTEVVDAFKRVCDGGFSTPKIKSQEEALQPKGFLCNGVNYRVKATATCK